MNDLPEPIVLELAPLPREKIGPFIFLGLEKDAGPEEIEAHWAQRLIWARKNLIPIALTEINWAREVLNDPDRRVRADAASLNVDVTPRVLEDLTQRYGADPAGPSWRPMQVDQPPSGRLPFRSVPSRFRTRKKSVGRFRFPRCRTISLAWAGCWINS